MDRPRQLCKVGDLLIRMMLSRRWQAYLTVSLLTSFNASSRAGFGRERCQSDITKNISREDKTRRQRHRKTNIVEIRSLIRGQELQQSYNIGQVELPLENSIAFTQKIETFGLP
jgi:hypothetical protein